jgi:hypothetical protein
MDFLELSHGRGENKRGEGGLDGDARLTASPSLDDVVTGKATRQPVIPE